LAHTLHPSFLKNPDGMSGMAEFSARQIADLRYGLFAVSSLSLFDCDNQKAELNQ
jgi:hypothetical protein